ncbi:unnamed protein product, partial [Sphagnum balticum]
EGDAGSPPPQQYLYADLEALSPSDFAIFNFQERLGRDSATLNVIALSNDDSQLVLGFDTGHFVQLNESSTHSQVYAKTLEEIELSKQTTLFYERERQFALVTGICKQKQESFRVEGGLTRTEPRKEEEEIDEDESDSVPHVRKRDRSRTRRVTRERERERSAEQSHERPVRLRRVGRELDTSEAESLEAMPRCSFGQRVCDGCASMRGRTIKDRFRCFICLFLESRGEGEDEASEELFRVRTRGEPYVPQIDDEVRFFFQGYE